MATERWREVSRSELYTLYWKESLSQNKIADRLGFKHQQYISFLMKKYKIPTRPKFTLKKPILSPSPTLAYILGVLKGDGCVYYGKNGHYTIKLEVIHTEFAESFRSAIESINLNVNIYQRKKLTPRSKHLLWTVQTQSKIFYDWYKHLSFKGLSKIAKKFPEDFIRGFYESEGSFYRGIDHRWKRIKGWNCLVLRISIVCNDKEIISLIHSMLLKLKIPCAVYEQLIYSHCLQHRIQINSHQAVKNFLKLVKPCIKNG